MPPLGEGEVMLIVVKGNGAVGQTRNTALSSFFDFLACLFISIIKQHPTIT